MTTREKQEHGFTVLELLVVIVIIAVLAMIIVLTFNGLQRRANEAASATAVEAANKKLDVYKIANRFYPNALSDADVQNYSNTSYEYTVESDKLNYCLTATTNNASMFGSNTLPQPVKGGCPGHAVDGVPAITNYAKNPSVETGGLDNGWGKTLANANFTATTDTTIKKFGSYSAKMAVNTTTAADSYLQALVSVPSAGTYYVSAWVYITTGANGYTTGGTCTANNNDAKWSPNGTSWTSFCYNRATTNAWQQIKGTLVAAGAATFTLRFYPPVALNAALYVDGLMVTNGNTYNYADGTTPGWRWSGLANMSTSSGQAI